MPSKKSTSLPTLTIQGVDDRHMFNSMNIFVSNGKGECYTAHMGTVLPTDPSDPLNVAGAYTLRTKKEDELLRKSVVQPVRPA